MKVWGSIDPELFKKMTLGFINRSVTIFKAKKDILNINDYVPIVNMTLGNTKNGLYVV